MNRHIRIPLALVVLALFSVFTGLRCSYEPAEPPSATTGTYTSSSAPFPTGVPGNAGTVEAGGVVAGERNKVILENVVTLIDRAALAPGGSNFEVATKNLNQYFSNPNPTDYTMGGEARSFIAKELPEHVARLLRRSPEEVVKILERPRFEMQDARHLEDCMMYSRIARRVAGTGDDLTRVRRVFDWTIRQIMLVPPGSLAARGLFQAQARPFDVLLRGMASEDGGGWAERAWVFISLCRQLDLDAGLLTYTPQNASKDAKPEGPIPWICAVLVDGKPYLFDARIGLPIPGPDGKGVAILEDVLRDPLVLARLDLPGQSAYGATRAQLLGSPSKIGILLDSSPGYLAPRMRLLQHELSGKDRTILFRDPIEQGQKFADALGPRFGGAKLWEMPIMVYTLLFTSADFVQATLWSITLFDPRLPLVYARVKQMRGETSEAITEYVSMRFAERALLRDKKTPMPLEEQRAMDIYSTYFLGLCHLEQNNPEQAEFFFRETLKLLPAPGPGQFFYHMFRWGAESNLARLLEARGEFLQATAYYSQLMPTSQQHGNFLRARDLIWRNPTGPLPAPLPLPPPADVMIQGGK